MTMALRRCQGATNFIQQVVHEGGKPGTERKVRGENAAEMWQIKPVLFFWVIMMDYCYVYIYIQLYVYDICILYLLILFVIYL